MSHPSRAESDCDILGTFEHACVWFKCQKPLMNNAKYCQECFDGHYRLCTRCKVPYPDAKYFDASNSNRCNSCHKKYVKEHEKREQQKKQEPVTKNIQPERPPIKRRISTSSDSDDSGEESVRVLQTLLLQALKNEKVLREKRKRKKRMKKNE